MGSICQPPPCLVYFRLMDVLERLSCSVVKTLLAQESRVFANALESWLFLLGQRGLFAKHPDTVLAFFLRAWGCGGERSLCQYKQQGQGRGGREEGCTVQNLPHPSPASEQSALPRLRSLEAPCFHEGAMGKSSWCLPIGPPASGLPLFPMESLTQCASDSHGNPPIFTAPDKDFPTLWWGVKAPCSLCPSSKSFSVASLQAQRVLNPLALDLQLSESQDPASSCWSFFFPLSFFFPSL